MLKAAPSRPRETLDQLEEKIQRLEFKRSTSTLSLKDEKQILNEISVIGKAKNEIRRYNQFQIDIDKNRASQDSLREAMRQQIARISELREVVSKVTIAKKIGIPPSDVVVESIDVADKDVGNVVGKSGANVKALEEAHGVSIEVGNKGTASIQIKISGRPNDITKAKQEILESIAGEDVSVVVTPATIKALLAQKGAHRTRIESEFRVRITIEKESNSIKFRGAKTCIDNAKSAIDDILDSGVFIEVDSKIIPIVIGKGGETIKSIQEDCGVEIDIERTGAKSVLRLYGEEDNVIRAKATLEVFIEENSEHEEVYSHVNIDMARSLIGSKGSIIKRLELESGAFININAKGDGEPKSDGPALTVKGTREALIKARELIDAHLLIQSKENVKIDVSSTVMSYLRWNYAKIQSETGANIDIARVEGFIRVRGKEENVAAAVEKVNHLKTALTEIELMVHTTILGAIVGKAGANINRINTESGAFIEIVKNENGDQSKVVMIGFPVNVQAAKLSVQEIIDANFRKTVSIGSANLIGGFCGKGGVNIKAMQSSYSSVSFDIDKDSHSVVLQGPIKDVEEAADAVTAWKTKYLKENVEIEMTEDQINLLSVESVKAIMAETSSNIQVVSKASLVRVTGSETAVASAVKMVKDKVGYDGEILRDYIDFPSEFFGPILGKSGANIQKLQAEYSCRIKIDRDKSRIELLGKKEIIVASKASMLLYLKDLVVSKEVDFPADKVNFLVGVGGQNIKQLQEVTKANINISKPATPEAKIVSVRIKGTSTAVIAAAQAMEDIGSGFVRFTINLADNQIVALESNGGLSSLKNVGQKYGVKIRLEKDAHSLVIVGSDAEVSKARLAVFSTLKFFCPNQFSIYPVQKNILSTLDKKYSADFASMRESTGAACDIDIPNASVLLSGMTDAVQKAEVALRVLLEKYKRENVEIQVSSKTIPVIIGKGGANIKKLREDTGADINIEDRSLGVSYVVISGAPEKVVAARDILHEILASEKDNHEEIEITQYEAAVVIGKGGATVRRLQEETGARINLDKESGLVAIHGRDRETTLKGKSAVELVLSQYRAEQEEKAAQEERERPVRAAAARETEKTERKKTVETAPVPEPVFAYDSTPVGGTFQEPAKKKKSQKSGPQATESGTQQVLGILLGAKSPMNGSTTDSIDTLLPSNAKGKGDVPSVPVLKDSNYYKSTAGYTLRL
jgi:polyribonucleotide nucleotidyltransferase